MAAQSDIESRLAEKIVTVNVSCELLKLPYRNWSGLLKLRYTNWSGYRAAFRADQSIIDAPAGSQVILNVNFANKTNQGWNTEGANYMRLGVQLKTATGQTIGELAGAKLSTRAAGPGGRESISIPIDLPVHPGDYRLALDVVHEFVCWFSERGSPPLVFTLHVD